MFPWCYFHTNMVSIWVDPIFSYISYSILFYNKAVKIKGQLAEAANLKEAKLAAVSLPPCRDEINMKKQGQ